MQRVGAGVVGGVLERERAALAGGARGEPAAARRARRAARAHSRRDLAPLEHGERGVHAAHRRAAGRQVQDGDAPAEGTWREERELSTSLCCVAEQLVH